MPSIPTMLQTPPDSLTPPHASAAPLAADTAATAQPATHKERPKTVWRVLKDLPPDATPAQQDSAVRANFPVPDLTFPAGRHYYLPLAKDSDTTPRLHPLQLFERRLTREAPWNEAPLTMQSQGVEGDPLPYRFRTDDYVTSALLLSFFLVVWIISRSRHFLGRAVKNFFARPGTNAPDGRDAPMLRGRTFLLFQTCFLLGILFTDYTQERLPAVFNQSSPYRVLGFGVAGCLAYFILKTALYRLVNNIFFDRDRADEWLNGYRLLILAEGAALLPVTLLLVYFDMRFETLAIAFLAVVSVVKILLLVRTQRLFFDGPLRCLHLFLYFCALEILPMALLWRALVFFSHYLITIT